MTRQTRRDFFELAGCAVAGALAAPASGDEGAAGTGARPLADLPTPALLIDEPALTRNVEKMAAFLKQRGVALRPHAKTHKSADIARRQLDAGAIGMCCAKVSEAEVLHDAGVGPILVTSPLATYDKAERFSRIARMRRETMVVIDSEFHADLLARAAAALGYHDLRVLIDIDVGLQRTGVQAGEAAVLLAKYARATGRLKVMGVQAYAGHLMHVSGWEERQRRSLASMQPAVETRKAIEAVGIECPIFSVGGTGTFDIDTEIEGVTELQCGSYIFMDQQYRIIGGPRRDLFDAFEPALFVWSTVISQPTSQSMTVDAGYKALWNEEVRPVLLDHPQVSYRYAGDEHGILDCGDGAKPIRVGDKLKIFVAHCDPTVNLYDHYHVIRDTRVVDRWRVTARGLGE